MEEQQKKQTEKQHRRCCPYFHSLEVFRLINFTLSSYLSSQDKFFLVFLFLRNHVYNQADYPTPEVHIRSGTVSWLLNIL